MQFAGVQMGWFPGCVHNGFGGKDLNSLDEQEKSLKYFQFRPTYILIHFE